MIVIFDSVRWSNTKGLAFSLSKFFKALESLVTERVINWSCSQIQLETWLLRNLFFVKKCVYTSLYSQKAGKYDHLTILTRKNLRFTEFSTKIHWNARLAAFDVFHMFTQSIQVLEYLCTCHIFCLINGSRVTFGIFDWHVLKKGILSYQTT